MFAEVDQSSTSVSLDTRGRKVIQNHQKRRNDLDKERRNSEGKGGVEAKENKGNRDKEENGEGEIKENAEEKGKRI